MKKLIALLVTIVMSLTFIGCNKTTIEKDEIDLNEKILSPFKYTLGQNSWDKAEDISPNALVIFYFSLPLMGEITIDEDYDIDKTYGNPLIPADDLESTVQKYFDFEIPKDYIKDSQYYLEESNSYFTGGIGSVVNIESTQTEQKEGKLTISYESSINSSDFNESWDGSVTVILDDEGGFKYKSFTTNRHNSDGENILPSTFSDQLIRIKNNNIEDSFHLAKNNFI